ncbi:hypothetical protein WJR50_33050 [Catalinimonas sp. 4WD22]|uniref:hypothetical protein n=1 Tax=Catalinimonas locisalis TaxID=3133978 RepID=UPI003100C6BB
MENKKKRINSVYVITLDNKPLLNLKEELLIQKNNEYFEGLYKIVGSKKEITHEEAQAFINAIDTIDESLSSIDKLRDRWQVEDTPYMVCSNLTIASKMCAMLVKRIDDERLDRVSYKRMYNFFKSGEEDYKIKLHLYAKDKKVVIANLTVSKRDLISNPISWAQQHADRKKQKEANDVS